PARDGPAIRPPATRAQLGGGGVPPGLARHNSVDASAKDGGDLGTLKRGELAQEIEVRILALKPGEVSRPFRSSLGWHVFRLEAKDMLEGGGLQRVREQVKDILYREKDEARMEAWIKEMKERAIIEVRVGKKWTSLDPGGSMTLVLAAQPRNALLDPRKLLRDPLTDAATNAAPGAVS